jgi:hypothetical protein
MQRSFHLFSPHHRGIRVVLLPMLLLVVLFGLWEQGESSADHMFVAIAAYFGAIAIWIAADLLLRWRRPGASPPGTAPSGLPTGPRRPRPLGAYAEVDR